jgi:hypothetical protein
MQASNVLYRHPILDAFVLWIITCWPRKTKVKTLARGSNLIEARICADKPKQDLKPSSGVTFGIKVADRTASVTDSIYWQLYADLVFS